MSSFYLKGILVFTNIPKKTHTTNATPANHCLAAGRALIKTVSSTIKILQLNTLTFTILITHTYVFNKNESTRLTRLCTVVINSISILKYIIILL